MILRNHQNSDGRLQTWRISDNGVVTYKEKHIKLTEAQKEKLRAGEQRRAIADAKIRKNKG